MRKNILAGFAAGAVITLMMTACGQKSETQNSDSAEVAQIQAGPSAIELAAANTDEYQETPSGLKYKVLREGTGKSPNATDYVVVNYQGTFTDGTVFDSSYERNQPASFPLNGVIPGWTEGLQLMQEGAAYEFYIPYNLAYGEQGRPGGIPPKSDLIFVVELLQVQ